jgi:hypothetical protein
MHNYLFKEIIIMIQEWLYDVNMLVIDNLKRRDHLLRGIQTFLTSTIDFLVNVRGSIFLENYTKAFYYFDLPYYKNSKGDQL